MSKKFKSQASSARAANSTFGTSAFGFGSPSAGFQTSSSSLSYVTELPDLTSISDPNVVVSLRNLGKKDSTTKAKALEELQEYVKSNAAATELSVLEAWVDLYPRTSIDNSRRVRQLAHSIQGSLTISTGKRIAPLLPKVVGAWLSGLYDADKSVARVTQETLVEAFQTDEKRQRLWKAYKDSLLAYADDAILLQTAKTLSDDRSTTPDDAEAKYARVVGTAIKMLGNLIKNTTGGSNAVDQKFNDKILILLANKKLWEFANNSDPDLRRAIFSLAILCVGPFESGLDWNLISSCFLGKALYASQLGSSQQYAEALIILTKIRPQMWTTDYASKTAVSKRLIQFLSRGSQRGTEVFWSNVDNLVKIIPSAAWLKKNENAASTEDITTIAEALHSGLTHSDEPRQNLLAAWACYVDLCFWLSDQVNDISPQPQFLTDSVSPLLVQYVMNEPDQPSWTLPGTSALQIVAIAMIRMKDRGSLLESLWSRLCELLCEKMKLSLPESSRDFEKSQENVIATSIRLFKMKSKATGSSENKSNEDIVAKLGEIEKPMWTTALSLLKSRNGKPYGAAAVLEDVISQPDFDRNDTRIVQFIDTDIPSLLDSPSTERLVSIVRICRRPVAPMIQRLLANATDNTRGEKVLAGLLSKITYDEFLSCPELSKAVLEAASTLSIASKGRLLLEAILQNPNLASTAIQTQIIEQILIRLLEEPAASMQFLQKSFEIPAARFAFTSGDRGSLLMSKLLTLSESSDQTVADEAFKLLEIFKSAEKDGTAPTTTFTIIADQLSGKGSPISILSLIDLAMDAFKGAEDKEQAADIIVPDAQQWEKALQPHFSEARPHSLAITSRLQGSIYTIQASKGIGQHNLDIDDFSMAFRLVLYLTKILCSHDMLDHLSKERTDDIFRSYPVALQLVNEKLTLESANKIWINSTAEVVDEAAEALSEGNAMMQKWIELDKSNFTGNWIGQFDRLQGIDSRAYYEALTASDIASRTIDMGESSLILSRLEKDVIKLHRSENILRLASITAALRDSLGISEQGRKFVNELIADATGLKSLEQDIQILRPIVVLNIVLGGESDALEGIPSQRLVFLMQALVRLLAGASGEEPGVSEVLELLQAVLPVICDIYGDHWEQIFQVLIKIWDHGNDLDNDLPVLHASLRLYQRLRSLVSMEDVNEDLLDSWNTSKPVLEDGLLQCLKYFDRPGEGTNQPRQITVQLLRRLLLSINPRDAEALYPLLSSPEEAVQSVCYELLHRTIPTLQEQFSLDLALERTAIHLPVELTLLVQDEFENVSTTAFKRYLLCWNLVFDHFGNASYKLREAYTNDIKDSNQLSGLLTHICSVIRITSGHPVNASKYDIRSFDSGTADFDEAEMQWLCIHLFYNCLLHLPSLTKAWFIEQKNRTKSPLEAWTQKYISPAIVSASMATVTDWAATQDADDAPVTVKTSPKGSEVVASIEIDPESPAISIAISLPGSYPLDSPSVHGRTRVGVSEKNWQSWLRTIQIIIFSTGSIIEGLVAFRRNVQGALRGQSECAICYSIIGTDMQTPNKRCGTCKNTFHGSCLFRWFKSSNSSSCPLCRNNFNYA